VLRMAGVQQCYFLARSTRVIHLVSQRCGSSDCFSIDLASLFTQTCHCMTSVIESGHAIATADVARG